MRCRDFVERLDALLCDELEPGERLGMHLHALRCRACAAYRKSYERTVGLVTWAFGGPDEEAEKPRRQLPR